jgi:hypothetical protein
VLLIGTFSLLPGENGISDKYFRMCGERRDIHFFSAPEKIVTIALCVEVCTRREMFLVAVTNMTSTFWFLKL